MGIDIYACKYGERGRKREREGRNERERERRERESERGRESINIVTCTLDKKKLEHGGHNST